MLLLCRSKQPPKIEHPCGLAAKLSLVPERRIYCFATGAGMICTLLQEFIESSRFKSKNINNSTGYV